MLHAVEGHVSPSAVKQKEFRADTRRMIAETVGVEGSHREYIVIVRRSVSCLDVVGGLQLGLHERLPRERADAALLREPQPDHAPVEQLPYVAQARIIGEEEENRR